MNRTLTAIARIFAGFTMYAALCCLGGCGGNDVGPNPPWNLSADPAPQTARK